MKSRPFRHSPGRSDDSVVATCCGRANIFPVLLVVVTCGSTLGVYRLGDRVDVWHGRAVQTGPAAPEAFEFAGPMTMKIDTW